MPIGYWKKIAQDPSLQRSSHVLSVVDRKAYIFGGELEPRVPRDNTIFEINSDAEDQGLVTPRSSTSAPSPRVGPASTSTNGKIYVYSGRGGQAMQPIEENGQLHQYDPGTSEWTLISPKSQSTYPPARSYHCMTSDDKSIFVHAGCPESGRLADLWSYNLKTREWVQLADAPGPQRGGTSIAHIDGKLYRMNGFDGKTEQGGSLDIFDIASRCWSSKPFNADGKNGPEPRSVSALVPLTVDGRQKLLTMFGERDPSSLGHAGAGKMLGDWWVYDIGEDKWEQGENGTDEVPCPRGWFDADALGGQKVMVAGGLSEDNERLDDVWVLSF